MGCPLCGSERVERRFPVVAAAAAPAAAHFGSSRAAVEPTALQSCGDCGGAWQHPAPSAAAVAAAYRDMTDPLYLAEESGRRRALRRSLIRLERRSGGRRGRLLDVGCSAGLFMEIAEASGWEVHGVEPSRWLAERARRRFGARVTEAILEEADLPPASFAAVCLWDVLEHVGDADAFLARAIGLLAPGGVLALNVPNARSLIARLLGRRWPLLLPEHLTYFSPRSLRLLLARHGLQDVRFYLHPVHFSAEYIAYRLAQHRLPGSAALARALAGSWLGRRSLPILMGELTAIGVKAA
jgi:SAM-dependent methyltransferase